MSLKPTWKCISHNSGDLITKTDRSKEQCPFRCKAPGHSRLFSWSISALEFPCHFFRTGVLWFLKAFSILSLFCSINYIVHVISRTALRKADYSQTMDDRSMSLHGQWSNAAMTITDRSTATDKGIQLHSEENILYRLHWLIIFSSKLAFWLLDQTRVECATGLEPSLWPLKFSWKEQYRS